MFAIYHRLSVMFTGLRKLLGTQGGPRPSWHMPAPTMSGLFLIRIWRQLSWIEYRLDRAIARAAAGKPPSPPRPGRPRPPHREPEPPKSAVEATARATDAAIRRERLPRREYWLIAAIPNFSAIYRDHLQAIMATPELSPHLTHPSVNRLLRPLCRMLGLSAFLPPSAPRPASSPPATIEPGAPPAAPPPTPLPEPRHRPVRRSRPAPHPPPNPLPA